MSARPSCCGFQSSCASTQARNSDISRHILPTSATMVGVSITIIGIVRLIETRAGVATIIDNLASVVSVLC